MQQCIDIPEINYISLNIFIFICRSKASGIYLRVKSATLLLACQHHACSITTREQVMGKPKFSPARLGAVVVGWDLDDINLVFQTTSSCRCCSSMMR